MPYLISDISDDTELLPVNTALSNPTYPLFYDLASETIKILAGANTTEWQVARGVGNTQAVRHSRGTPLVLNASPYGGGGGGVTGDNTVDAPSTVDTLVSAGASITGGTMTLAVVISATAPTTTYPGLPWLQNHTDGHYSLWIRDAGDANWLTPGVEEGLRYAGSQITGQIYAAPNAANLLGNSDDGQTAASVEVSSGNGVKATMSEPLGGYFQTLIPPLATEFQMWDANHGMPYPGISFLMGTANPSSGAGKVAAAGSFYSRNNAGAGELWFKTGAGDTAWSKLTA